jgi:tetratricopeptide (TPR) repeat protein
MFAAVLAFAVVGGPALADQKVDEATAKANDQFKKGRSEEALKTLQKLPPSAEALTALGRLQEKMGSFDDSIATLTRAADMGQGPAKGDALAALASVELQAATAKNAIAHAHQAVAAAATPLTLATLARAQARVDGTKALETADKAVAAGASSAVAHEARGAALLALGKLDEALAAFRKALELDQKLVRAHVGMATAFVAAGKGVEAEAAAKKALEDDPNSAEAHATLGIAILTVDPKRWNDAIAEAQDGAFKNAKSPEIQMIVAKIFEADGRYDQAAGSYKKALETDPGFAPARTALINAQFRRGDLDGALAEAVKVVAEAPGNGEAQRLVGELYLRKQDYVSSVLPLEKAVQLLPSSAEAHYYLGRAYQFTNKTKEALSPYRRAVELAPANADYRTTYALILGVNGQYDAGVAEIKKVIATPGYKNTAGYTNLGWLYRNMEPPRTEESVAAYKRALEIDPKNAQAALGLGWAYSYTRLWDESIGAYKKACEIDPKLSGQCLKGLAWAYFFKREFPKSRETLRRAQAEGGGDARLDAQLDRIEQIIKEGRAATEEDIKKAEEERKAAARLADKLDAVQEAVRSPSCATRAKAAHDFAAIAGADSVPTLLWLLNDKCYDVRNAACASLGSLGPAGKRALPTLKAIMAQPPTVNPFADKQEQEQELREGDFRKLCRDAIVKIGS